MTRTETLLYKPSLNNSDFTVVMAYPAIYSFAMASLGYLWLFKQLDEAEDIAAERIYSDSKDLSFNPNTCCKSKRFEPETIIALFGVVECDT